MPLSKSPNLPYLVYLLSAIPTGFGLNAILNPASALSWFSLPYPTSPQDQALIDAILKIYGARDIFMGLALFVAAYHRNSRIMGWILVFTAAVAAADGAICPTWESAMNHWGYGPVLLGLGSLIVAGW